MQTPSQKLTVLTAPPQPRFPPVLAQWVAALLTVVEGWSPRAFGAADDDIGWDDGEPEPRR